MKSLLIIIAILVCANTHARTLHYGNSSVELTDTKKTSPALHIQINNEKWYGALFDASTAPTSALHIAYGGNEYWVGPWCAWRGYMPAGTGKCVDIPTELFNRFLTLDEANKYIIPTDITQWELISDCNTFICQGSDVDFRNNPKECACVTGTLQPGTYLFFERYSGGSAPYINAQIAIFNHAVGYVSMHASSVFSSLIDTEHETFVSYTLETAKYNSNTRHANVTNLPTADFTLSVYKLK